MFIYMISEILKKQQQYIYIYTYIYNNSNKNIDIMRLFMISIIVYTKKNIKDYQKLH